MQLSKSLFLRDEHRHFLRVECSLSDWLQKPVSFTAKHKYLDRINKEKYTLLYLCKKRALKLKASSGLFFMHISLSHCTKNYL